MKKLIKLITFSACAVGALVIINHRIFKRAGAAAQSKHEQREYKWRHGRLRYVTAGKGEPLLLIHGLSAGSGLLEWEHLIAEFAKEYRVYAFDFLGYGGSSKPNLSYSAYLFSSQINDFISDVIGSPVNVVASNEGGPIAMAACVLKPELYNKILLASPSRAGEPVKSLPCGQTAQSLIDMPIIGTTLYNLFTSRLFCMYSLRKNFGLPLDLPGATHRAAHAGGVGNKYSFASCFSDMMNIRLDVIVPLLDLPVHVCWGAHDSSNPLSNFRAIRSANDDIGLTVFENAGKYPHKNQPNKFLRVCLGFFAG